MTAEWLAVEDEAREGAGTEDLGVVQSVRNCFIMRTM